MHHAPQNIQKVVEREPNDLVKSLANVLGSHYFLLSKVPEVPALYLDRISSLRHLTCILGRIPSLRHCAADFVWLSDVGTVDASHAKSEDLRTKVVRSVH